MNSRIRGVIFDLDDTLVLTWKYAFEKTCRTASHLGLEHPSKELFLAHYGDGFEAASHALFPQISFATYEAAYRQQKTHSYREAPGAVEVVHALENLGYQTAVLTNGTRDKALNKLRGAGFPDFILQRVWASEDVLRLKPAPDGLQAIMHHLNIQPPSTFFVGDSETDRMAAMQCGVFFIPVGASKLMKTGSLAHALARAITIYDNPKLARDRIPI